MNIIPANASDADAIKNMAYAIWLPYYSTFIAPEQLHFMLQKFYREEALIQAMQSGENFFVGLENEKPIAFASLSLVNEAEKIFKLNKLYLDLGEQGKGFGVQLLKSMEEIARQKGGKVLRLNVNRFNPTLKFYLKNGFEIKYSIDIPLSHYFLNDYVMEKTL